MARNDTYVCLCPIVPRQHKTRAEHLSQAINLNWPAYLRSHHNESRQMFRRSGDVVHNRCRRMSNSSFRIPTWQRVSTLRPYSISVFKIVFVSWHWRPDVSRSRFSYCSIRIFSYINHQLSIINIANRNLKLYKLRLIIYLNRVAIF